MPREFLEIPRRSDLLDFRQQFHDWYFSEQDEDSASLRRKASALRHQLTTDLGTAEQSQANWIIPRSIAPPPQRDGAMTGSLPLQG